MRTVSIILIIVIGLLFVVPVAAQDDDSPEPVDVSLECRQAIDDMATLIDDIPDLPKHLQQEKATRTDNDFDAHQFFTVLDHLAVEDGYFLDYVYMYDFMGGRPFLYTLPEDQEPFATFADYAEANDNKQPNYLDHIAPEDSPAGYMQLAVLDVVGEQFYLHWHSNYNDYRIICDAEMLDALIMEHAGETFGIALEKSEQNAARAIDLTPTVTLYDDVAEIRAILFTRWGGFYEWTVTVDRELPREVHEYESESLVEYDCGIMF